MGNLLIEGIPEIPVGLSDKLNQYQNTRSAVMVDWLKDGEGILILTRFGESDQLHLVEQPGGYRKQLTFFKEPVFTAAVCPAKDRHGFLFAKDIGGSEAYQLFYFDVNTGTYRMLTDGKSKNGYGVWNRDGSAFIYSSTKRNNVDHDLYLYNFSEGEEKEEMIWHGQGMWFPISWSPDKKAITVGHFRSINECHIYNLDLETGRCNAVCTLPKVACRGGYWDHLGEGIYYTSDELSQFRQLYYFELKTGKRHILTPDLQWDIERLSLSPNGADLAFTVNENGMESLYFYDTQKGEYRRYEHLPAGQVGSLKWHPSQRKLAITVNTATRPSDVYVINLDNHEIVKWTNSEVGGLNSAHFVFPQLIRYPTFDEVDGANRQIPAFYYRPEHKKGPHPVLIYIHGGPESQFRPSFSPIFQYYLNELGIAIIAPNVRGSTGYGKQFLKLDNGYKREDSVRDIGKLIDWVEEQPELDENRISVMGGSYGGYMVLASMAHYNDRLKCGIDIVGISNFVTFLENTKPYRRNLRRVEYGDERDPEMRAHLQRISPTTNAHKITKPMLIVQGLNDPRVPASEAEQMLRAIRKNGGEAWYLLAKDEGHGFRKKSNRDFYTKAVILFLRRYLLVDS